MHIHEKQKILLINLRQTEANKRAMRKIKTAPPLFSGKTVCRVLSSLPRQRSQIKHCQRDWLRWTDYLRWSAINGGESGAQDFVPPHYFAECLFKRRNIERPFEAQENGEVI